MGVTIFYRGRLADLTRIEDFEDRLIDGAPEIGGRADLADLGRRRSGAHVRGVILDLAPGQNRPVCCCLPRDG